MSAPAVPRSAGPALDQQTLLLCGLALFCATVLLLPVLVVTVPLLLLWSRARLPWWMVCALAFAIGGLTSLVRPVSIDGYLTLLLAVSQAASPLVQAHDWPALRALVPDYARAFAPYACTVGPPLAAVLSLRHWWLPASLAPSAAFAAPPTPEKGEGARMNERTEASAPAAAWLTGDDFAVLASTPAPALWGECFEEGSVTVLAGAEKTGKSELLAGLVGALVAGTAAYLGWPLHGAPGGEPVVILSEETPTVYRFKALRMANLAARSLSWHARLRWKLGRFFSGGRKKGADIYVRSGPLVGDRGVEHIREHVLAGAQQALRVGARLLIVDSLKHWCQQAISQDDAASTLMASLKEASALTRRVGRWPRQRRQGLIVVAIHHLNRDGQWLGPTTIRSQADFLMSYTPPEGIPVDKTTERVLSVRGRFAELAPEPLRLRWDDEHGGLMATDAATSTPRKGRTSPRRPQEPAAAKEQGQHGQPHPLLAWFALQDATAWLSGSAVVEAAPGGLGRTAVLVGLRDLADVDQLERRKVGKGYEYRRPPMLRLVPAIGA